MNWNTRIDAYCERLGPGFWAEPLNAATNAAFLLAALVGLVLAMRAGRLDGPIAWLAAVILAVGTGSFLFHTYATLWAAMADTSPILVFILSYFAIAMNRFAGYGWVRSLLMTLAFFVAMVALSSALRQTVGPYLGRSTGYLPALLAMFGVGLWLAVRRHPAGARLIAAAGVFAVSLTFRALDVKLCDLWPIGTHFVWHLLNGTVLGMLLVTLVRHGARPRLAGRAPLA